jgi:hypothetical protein
VHERYLLTSVLRQEKCSYPITTMPNDEEALAPETAAPENGRPNLVISEVPGHMFKTWLYIFEIRLWLAIWLVILMTAIVFVPIAFLFEDLGLGLAPLIAVGLCSVNLPLYMRARGFDKSMSAGHLPFLIPLMIYWTIRLADGLDLSSTVWVAVFYFMYVVLGICLLFDIYDTYEWFWNRNYNVISCDDAPSRIEKQRENGSVQETTK